jgi:hypothetical protein
VIQPSAHAARRHNAVRHLPAGNIAGHHPVCGVWTQRLATIPAIGVAIARLLAMTRYIQSLTYRNHRKSTNVSGPAIGTGDPFPAACLRGGLRRPPAASRQPCDHQTGEIRPSDVIPELWVSPSSNCASGRAPPPWAWLA